MNAFLQDRRWIWVLALALGMLPVLFWGMGMPWQNLPPTWHPLSLGEQVALLLAVYAIKLVYMLLALLDLALVWGASGGAGLALKGSLAAFWLGEFSCGINILFFAEEALVFEYLHSLFMVVCIALLFYSVMEGVDEHILHFSDPRARCAMVGVCKTCGKAQNSPKSASACLLQRLFAWMMPLAAVIALMPLMAQPLNYSFNTTVFGVSRTLTHLMPIQWYELRFSPAAALGMMAAAWLALVWRGGTVAGLRLSKILLSGAVGQLGFTLMRLAFASFYREDLVWFIFWEELSELILAAGVLVVLLLISPRLTAGWREKFGKLVA